VHHNAVAQAISPQWEFLSSLAAHLGLRNGNFAASWCYRETMARTLFPSGSPIGRRYGRGGPQNAGDIEVIGVVKDVKYNSLEEDPQPGDYLPYTQMCGTSMTWKCGIAEIPPRSLLPFGRQFTMWIAPCRFPM